MRGPFFGACGSYGIRMEEHSGKLYSAGPILTPMCERLDEKIKNSILEAAVPIGRWGKPERIPVALIIPNYQYIELSFS